MIKNYELKLLRVICFFTAALLLCASNVSYAAKNSPPTELQSPRKRVRTSPPPSIQPLKDPDEFRRLLEHDFTHAKEHAANEGIRKVIVAREQELFQLLARSSLGEQGWHNLITISKLLRGHIRSTEDLEEALSERKSILRRVCNGLRKFERKGENSRWNRYLDTELALAREVLLDLFPKDKRAPVWAKQMHDRMRDVSTAKPSNKFPLLYIAEAILHYGYVPAGMTEDLATKHAKALLAQYIEERHTEKPENPRGPSGMHSPRAYYKKTREGVRRAQALLAESAPASKKSLASPFAKEARKGKGKGKARPHVGEGGHSSGDESSSDSDNEGMRLIRPNPGSGRFDATTDPHVEPTASQNVIHLNDQSFMMKETSSFRYSCGFYSSGLSRFQAANLLLDNIDDPVVRGYVGEQLHVALLRNDREQLPHDQTPFDPLKVLIQEKNDLENNSDLVNAAFNDIERVTHTRPLNTAEALATIASGVIGLNADVILAFQANLRAIQAKEAALKNACKEAPMVSHYITQFVAQPYNTMEFQNDGADGTQYHSVLDAIAHLRGHSLRLYKPLDGAPGQMVLLHSFDHPNPAAPVRHILHTGGRNGQVGHFRLLEALPTDDVIEDVPPVLPTMHLPAKVSDPKSSKPHEKESRKAVIEDPTAESDDEDKKHPLLDKIKRTPPRNLTMPEREARNDYIQGYFKRHPKASTDQAWETLKARGWVNLSRKMVLLNHREYKKSLKGAVKKLTPKEKIQYNERIVALREEGKEFKEIANIVGREFGVTITGKMCRVRYMKDILLKRVPNPSRVPLEKKGGAHLKGKDQDEEMRRLCEDYSLKELQAYFNMQSHIITSTMSKAIRANKIKRRKDALRTDWNTYRLSEAREHSLQNFIDHRVVPKDLKISCKVARDYLVEMGLFKPQVKSPEGKKSPPKKKLASPKKKPGEKKRKPSKKKKKSAKKIRTE